MNLHVPPLIMLDDEELQGFAAGAEVNMQGSLNIPNFVEIYKFWVWRS